MMAAWPRHADGSSKQCHDWTIAEAATFGLFETAPAAVESITDTANAEYIAGRISFASHSFAMCAGHPVMLAQAIREAARG